MIKRVRMVLIFGTLSKGVKGGTINQKTNQGNLQAVCWQSYLCANLKTLKVRDQDMHCEAHDI